MAPNHKSFQFLPQILTLIFRIIRSNTRTQFHFSLWVYEIEMSSPEGLSSSVSDPFSDYVFPSVSEEHTSCCVQQNYNNQRNNNNNKCSSTQRNHCLQSNREYHSELRHSFHSEGKNFSIFLESIFLVIFAMKVFEGMDSNVFL